MIIALRRDLIEVYANYTLRDDGGIKVINRGKNNSNGKWKEAIGRAYFINEKNIGSLKVSFFWPFYGGYHIAKLDEDYTMALIVGPYPKLCMDIVQIRKPKHEIM